MHPKKYCCKSVHFTLTESHDSNNNKIQIRKCNYCDKKYSSSAWTGHLIKHLKTSHCMKFNQTKDYQTVLTADEIYQIDSALLLCLIFCFLPFSIVENRHFKEFALLIRLRIINCHVEKL